MRDSLIASPALALLVLVTACGNSDGATAPLAPGSGGTNYRDGGTRPATNYPIFRRDSGMTDDDAGDERDGGAGNDECANVEPAPLGSVEPPPGEFYNTVLAPTDFAVTRVVVGWEASCAQPTIHVVLSDGRCADGDGHELTFLIPADGIENGTVVLGQNLITPEPASGTIRVRYARPDDLAPNGEWGTCDGAAGNVDFVDQLETTNGSQLEGRFQLELTRCDTGESNVQTLQGTFSVTLEDGLEDVCPQ